MEETTYLLDEIEISIDGFRRPRHFLQTEQGLLGELSVSFTSRQASYAGADGRRLEMSQPSFWRSEFELRRDEELLARAAQRRFFGREMAIEYQGQPYILQPAGFWTRAWQLLDNQETVLLQVEPRGILQRGAHLTVQGELPLDLLIFVYFLVHNRWQNEAAVVGAAAAAT
ncbi:MAG: hypothetical protein JXA37_10460 [Chloroflexia bacterium]|nr:hypothetical protein [Chloroflexia bacterium]